MTFVGWADLMGLFTSIIACEDGTYGSMGHSRRIAGSSYRTVYKWRISSSPWIKALGCYGICPMRDPLREITTSMMIVTM